MMSEDAMYDDGVVMEAVVEKFVKYFKSIFHHNNWYFASFIFCKFSIRPQFAPSLIVNPGCTWTFSTAELRGIAQLFFSTNTEYYVHHCYSAVLNIYK